MARAAIDSVAIIAATSATPTIRIKPVEEAHNAEDGSHEPSGLVSSSFDTPIR